MSAAVNAATLLGEIGQRRAAEERLTVLTARFPNHAPAHSNLGDLLKLRGQYETALQRYESAARLQPDDPEYALNIREIRHRSIPSWHFPMLMDRGRNDAFNRAIEQKIQESG